MKKTFLILATVTALATACSKETVSVIDNDTNRKVSLIVDITGSHKTKATGIAGDETDEEKISNFQVFVFNGNNLDGYAKATGSTSLKISCTAGSREIYAVVNAYEDLSSIAKKSDLLKTISTLNNRKDCFEMIGNSIEEINEDNQQVTVNVNRFAARVKVKKVTNALSSAALQKQSFSIKSMHLINVAGDVNYGLSDSYNVSKWYNMMCLESRNNLGTVSYDIPDAAVESGKSYTTAHYFYAYPNSKEYSSSITWSPRATMLVLKVYIGGVLYDYPITLPALESNKSYEIDEIKITRPGNPDDGIEGGTDEMTPVEGHDCTFEIEVNPWAVVTVSDNPEKPDEPITI